MPRYLASEIKVSPVCFMHSFTFVADLNLGAMGGGPLLQGRLLQGHDHYTANATLPLLQNAHHRNDSFHFTSQSNEQPAMYLSSQNTMLSQSMTASLPSTVHVSSTMPRSNSFGGGNISNAQLPPNGSLAQQSPRTGKILMKTIFVTSPQW